MTKWISVKEQLPSDVDHDYDWVLVCGQADGSPHCGIAIASWRHSDTVESSYTWIFMDTNKSFGECGYCGDIAGIMDAADVTHWSHFPDDPDNWKPND